MSGTPDAQSRSQDSLVPISEVALPEVASQADFEASLARIMSSDLTGFTIRKAGLDGEEVPDVHSLAVLARDTLNSLGYIFEVGFNMQGVHTGYRRIGHEDGIGDLHIDQESGRSVQRVNVHATVLGSGKVSLAESGPKAVQKLKHNKTLERIKQEQRLNSFLLAGTTDPTIIAPTVHTTVVEAGDYVIFPLANARGPMWHRFDTASEEGRTVNIRELERDPNAEAKKRKAQRAQTSAA